MTPEQERWAEALQVLKMYGTGAEAFIASRIAVLRHDIAGVARWQAIGARLANIRSAEQRRD